MTEWRSGGVAEWRSEKARPPDKNEEGNPVAPRLKVCIVCGASRMTRKRITVERGHGRGPVAVVADICGNCGERYFDPDAMRAIEG